ncbi:hypothetical protein V1264_001172 [Littorina saxatilis]
MSAVRAWQFCISALFFASSWALPFMNTSIPGPFSGYQVFEVHVNETSALGPLLRSLETAYPIDIWGRPSKQSFDVMVSPEQLSDVIKFIKNKDASYNVKVQDVQRLLDEHMDHLEHHRERRSLPVSSVTRRYLKFRQIRQFLQNVRENATNADVTLSNLGRSFEGRMTPYVTIRKKNSQQENKQVVVIEAGIHAREWIAPSMALNIIYRLAFNPNNDPDLDELLTKFDWIIIPTVNPDGYVYSHRNSSTRLWRKTRTTLYSSDPHCMGVDGNRNFGYEWSDSPSHGGNSNPCTDNYSGPQGFSEPETRNLKTLLTRLGGRVALYLSLHSYGQFFLYPWGYDATATLNDESDMMEVGRKFADAMWERNRWYEVGSASQVLYEAAGAADDYARGGAGIKYAFTVELSPTDSSPHGFLLPAHHISTVVNDHWPAFKQIALTVWNKLNQTRNNNNNNNNNSNNNNNHYTDDSSPASAASSSNNINRRGSNSADNQVEVSINGFNYSMDPHDPRMSQWIQYYRDFLNYRRQYERYGGKRRARR